MISTDHVRLMARHNGWQNVSLFNAADALSEEQRQEDRRAFFGSLHTTLAHILWADRVWMNRFAGTLATDPQDDQGKGPRYQSWQELKTDRAEFDETILNWATGLKQEWLVADLTWWNTARTRKSTLAAWKLVAHFFNHQTHHRGQAHALLTANGAVIESTDLLHIALREMEPP